MGKFRLCKLFALLFVFILIITSNFAVGNFSSFGLKKSVFASAQNKTVNQVNEITWGDSNSYGDSLNSKGYSMSWDPSAQGNFAQSENSVELVIGISSKPNSYASLSGIISKNGGQITDTISMGGSKAVVVNISTKTASSFAGETRASGFSRYVEPNIKFKAGFTPNDPYWSYQWGPKKIQADFAWNTTTGNQTVLVAVVDTGIDYNHPDLAANYVPLGHDWVNGDLYPMDDNGHGTHCAGVIAAVLNNAKGMAGLAQVRIMAEKGLDSTGSGSSDDLANAIIHATDQGAKILSNSWGSNESSSLIHDAIAYADAHGVLVLASAGNSGSNAPQYPGAYDEVVGVTATDSADVPASFTNYGDWVDVAAPGVNIYSTYPNNAYVYMDGTSMACPHAAGVAALIWSRFPNMNAKLVRYQLQVTSDDLGTPGFDIYYGNGRINAKKAVEQAPPDHDVLVFDWQTPQFIKLGSSAAFNGTVFNRGIMNETDVQLKLLANNSLVNSTAIAFLLSGTSTTNLLSWTPTTAGTYNVTFCMVPLPGETITENNVIAKNFSVIVPPSEANWTLLATDPDEGMGLSLKAVSSQLQSNIVFFKVEYYRSWTNTANDIDAAIMVDTDQNPRTGLPDKYYPKQNDNIGADYIIIVGEGPEMWKWNATLGFFDTANPISLAYLDAPDNASSFVVGVSMADLNTNGFFDCAFCDPYSDWDWMPNTGYIPFIQAKYQRELAVTLETPKGLQPGETSLLNATVYNFGLNIETNVNLRILINGTIANSTTISNFVNGTSSKLNYAWTPNTEGFYNITAYAVPVANENVTSNNAKSRTVPVTYKIALISDNTELWDIMPVLDSMWINYDAYYDNYDYLYTQNLTLLLNYRTVVFYNYDSAITSAEQSALNSYLSAGGNLLVIGYDSLGHPDDPRLANVVRSSSWGNNVGEPDLYVVNSSPIMNGPYGRFPAGYHISGLYNDTDAAKADTARNATTVAALADGYDKIIATSSIPGQVVY